MELTPMQKAATSLRAFGRGEMVSLALAYLESHLKACELTSMGTEVHAEQREISDRVSSLTDDELIALLLPISALGHND